MFQDFLLAIFMWDISLDSLLKNHSRHNHNSELSQLAISPIHAQNLSALEGKMELQQETAWLGKQQLNHRELVSR